MAALGWPPPLSGLGVEQDASSQEWHGFEQAAPMVSAAQNTSMTVGMHISAAAS